MKKITLFLFFALNIIAGAQQLPKVFSFNQDKLDNAADDKQASNTVERILIQGNTICRD